MRPPHKATERVKEARRREKNNRKAQREESKRRKTKSEVRQKCCRVSRVSKKEGNK